VRFGAAVVVVFSHAWPVLVPQFPLPWPGHEAVVVFFVLSGLVIAHAADRPGTTLASYAVNRAARILPVAVPALVLSAIAGLWIEGTDLGSVAWLTLPNMVFLGQVWSFDFNPPVNGTFWSLNFEVWYYAIFGAALFARGPWRVIVPCLLGLAAGPKALMLLPTWLVGVAVYRWSPRIGERGALALVLLTAVFGAALALSGVPILLRGRLFAAAPDFMHQLGASNRFATDWLLALLVGLNFAAARSLGRFARPLEANARPIRALAGTTFTIYLFHAPLIAIALQGLKLPPVAVVPALVLAVYALALLFEKRLAVFRAFGWRVLQLVTSGASQTRWVALLHRPVRGAVGSPAPLIRR
jgi:peptidoglycan/LPS O-acetylase OafA/YrhL